jgi:hypothetical protein
VPVEREHDRVGVGALSSACASAALCAGRVGLGAWQPRRLLGLGAVGGDRGRAAVLAEVVDQRGVDEDRQPALRAIVMTRLAGASQHTPLL